MLLSIYFSLIYLFKKVNRPVGRVITFIISRFTITKFIISKIKRL